jgi:hypothetical protein
MHVLRMIVMMKRDIPLEHVRVCAFVNGYCSSHWSYSRERHQTINGRVDQSSVKSPGRCFLFLGLCIILTHVLGIQRLP